jgi:hypothetical protein
MPAPAAGSMMSSSYNLKQQVAISSYRLILWTKKSSYALNFLVS